MILPRVILSWPDRTLSPNGRAHWATKRRAASQAKSDTRALALAAGWRALKHEPREIHVSLTFCPPSARRYDLDNALASMKPHLDQLAATLGVDDSIFVPTLRRGDKCKLGGVIIDAEIIGFPAEGDNFRTVGEVAADLVANAITKRKGAAE